MDPEAKKYLIDALIESAIEIVNGLGDGEKWQIAKMPLAFKPNAFKGLLGR